MKKIDEELTDEESVKTFHCILLNPMFFWEQKNRGLTQKYSIGGKNFCFTNVFLSSGEEIAIGVDEEKKIIFEKDLFTLNTLTKLMPTNGVPFSPLGDNYTLHLCDFLAIIIPKNRTLCKTDLIFLRHFLFPYWEN